MFTFFLTVSSELLSLSSTGARNFPSTPSSCSSVSADPIRRKTRSTNAAKIHPHSFCLFKNYNGTAQNGKHGPNGGIHAEVALAEHVNFRPPNRMALAALIYFSEKLVLPNKMLSIISV